MPGEPVRDFSNSAHKTKDEGQSTEEGENLRLMYLNTFRPKASEGFYKVETL